jgi:dTMP kinase
MKSLEELTRIRAQALENQSRIKGELSESPDHTLLVRIGMATCGITAGARQTLTRLLDLMAADHAEHIRILQTGCMGDCDREPIVEVVDAGGTVTRYESVDEKAMTRLYHERLCQGGHKATAKKTHVISFEGGEGSGKTTILAMLKDHLEAAGKDVLMTREPGGVPIAELIRDIILHVDHTEMDIRTEALLYAAARRQHLAQKVFPELGKRDLIVFDRYVDSSVVYQGYVRGIGMEEVYQLNRFATEDFLPDLTLYLDIEPEEGLKRLHGANDREVNRLDLETYEFHEKVRQGYKLLLKQYPQRIVEIDASGSVTDVFDAVKKIVDKLC